MSKFGNPVKQLSAKAPYPGWSSSDGDTILFNTANGPGADNAARGFSFPQVATRTSGGWGSRPAANGPAPQAPVDAQTSSVRYQIPSADRSDVLFNSGSPFTADNPYINAGGNGSVNLAHGTAVDWLSKPTWAGANPAPGDTALRHTEFMTAGASDDLSTSYFMTRATLTNADATSGRVPLANWALYRWRDGQLSNAGVLPDGKTDPGGSVAAGLAIGGASSTNATSAMVSQYEYTHSVSPDGSGVLFVSPDPNAGTGRPAQLYLARQGHTTIQLSKWSGAGSAPSGASSGVVQAGGPMGSNVVSTSPAVYAVASHDQRVTLFSTADALTDDAPVDASIKTYRYSTDGGGSLTYMPDLTRTGPTSAGMVFNINDDGSRILYRTASSELRLWRTEDPMAPITLSTGVGPYAPSTQSGGITASRFSADGRTLVLMSRVPLDGEPNHPPGGAYTATQVYRYSEDDGRLDCVSCPPPTVTPRGPAAFQLQGSADNGFGATTNPVGMAGNRGISDDGKAVFFTTTSPLSDADHNAVADVYVWQAGDTGSPRLVSSGDPASKGDLLVDNSASGNDVFFVSERQLVEGDTDDLYDLYDARVNGGFAPPVKRVVPCEEDACQGTAPRESAPFTAAGSLTFAGGGNIASPAEEPAKIRVSKVKTVHGTSTKVKVKVPGKGKIRTSGSGLARRSKTAKKAGTYRVTVKLSKRARRTLKRKHRVKVRVSVRFAPAKGKAQRVRVSLTFKPKAQKKRKSSSRSVRRATDLASGSGKGR